MVTWAELDGEAGHAMHGVEGLVGDILDRARGNADQTVYVEKAVPADQWDAIAIGTVADILSCRDEDVECELYKASADEARAWFAARGVTY